MMLDEIPDRHRDVLAVLALLPSVHVGRWRDVTRDAGVRVDDFPAIAKALFERKLVDFAEREELEIVPELVPDVLEDAARRKTLQEIVPTALRRMVDHEARLVVAARSGLALGDAQLANGALSRWGADIVEAVGLHAPSKWIANLFPDLARRYLEQACQAAFFELAPLGKDVISTAAMHHDASVRAHASLVFGMRGEIELCLECIGEPNVQPLQAARGFACAVRGEWRDARKWFLLARTRKSKRLDDLPEPWSIFELYLTATGDDATAARDVSARIDREFRDLEEHATVWTALDALVELQTRGRARPVLPFNEDTWIEDALAAAVDVFLGRPPRALEEWRANAESAGYAWVERQLSDIAASVTTGRCLLAARSTRAPWELALDALEHAAVPALRPSRERAVVTWCLGFTDTGFVVKAHVGKKRDLSVRKVSRMELDPIDRDIARTILLEQRERVVLPMRLLELFVDRPNVCDREGKPLRIVSRDPEMRVATDEAEAIVRMHPARFEDGIAIEREGEEVRLFHLTEHAKRLQSIVGRSLRVPADGLARLGNVVGSLAAHVPVRANGAIAKDDRPVDPRVRVQLFRTNVGLRARLRVVPILGSVPLKPGVEPKEIVVPSGAGLRRVTRDLDRERANMESLLAACPTLAHLPVDGSDSMARELETCLELLVELDAAGALLEWQEGQPLRVPVLRNEFRIRVSGAGGWLDVEGEAEIDESRIVSMGQLLAGASKARGRFVPIGEDEWLALTDDVRSKLDAVTRVTQLGDGRVPDALLPGLDGIFEGFEVAWTKSLQERRAAIDAAEQSVPPLPDGLRAELRDYQLDGFRFLARRTEAKLGACLADDMGLGKTVQAIALLLHRAARGPQLVVCPKSVIRNWEEELARFAPSLVVTIASYGSMHRLPEHEWATVVFDEAHALKNPATQRWKAARALRREVAIALTGTPVENHLGELHAIFDLLVPGMLGSERAFQRAFFTPGATKALRQIVRPFVLRRTKSQVLSELPSKTEIVRMIPPSPDHLAFYEAVRRCAAQKIATLEGKNAPIEMLTEIMKLRRSAIDPRLVGGDAAPAGGKIASLGRLCSELRAEGHRALVFSQFLEVLDLAKSELDSIGISTRRLDGSMSADERASEIDAFQRGHGDVFLLSLKAGGVGLNLTAADYVVHLDPWWNPAVEDQASDRAHRIGQKRPVTIVRLVSQGTIEEKVLSLHGAKRRLADDVIGGADGAGTLDVGLLSDLLGVRA